MASLSSPYVAKHEQEKRRQYNERVYQIKHTAGAVPNEWNGTCCDKILQENKSGEKCVLQCDPELDKMLTYVLYF